MDVILKKLESNNKSDSFTYSIFIKILYIQINIVISQTQTSRDLILVLFLPINCIQTIKGNYKKSIVVIACFKIIFPDIRSVCILCAFYTHI